MTELAERAGYIEGLRILATVLENHPEIPLPYNGHLSPLTIMFLDGESSRALMAAAAKALPVGSWSKSGSDDYFELDGKVAGVKVKLTAYRDTVCRRVVTGTRQVTEEVPDPAAPLVKVTKTVEDVEWECGSVLAAAAGLATPDDEDAEAVPPEAAEQMWQDAVEAFHGEGLYALGNQE